jgi:hypothetical protein
MNNRSIRRTILTNAPYLVTFRLSFEDRAENIDRLSRMQLNQNDFPEPDSWHAACFVMDTAVSRRCDSL